MKRTIFLPILVAYFAVEVHASETPEFLYKSGKFELAHGCTPRVSDSVPNFHGDPETVELGENAPPISTDGASGKKFDIPLSRAHLQPYQEKSGAAYFDCGDGEKYWIFNVTSEAGNAVAQVGLTETNDGLLKLGAEPNRENENTEEPEPAARRGGFAGGGRGMGYNQMNPNGEGMGMGRGPMFGGAGGGFAGGGVGGGDGGTGSSTSSSSSGTTSSSQASSPSVASSASGGWGSDDYGYWGGYDRPAPPKGPKPVVLAVAEDSVKRVAAKADECVPKPISHSSKSATKSKLAASQCPPVKVVKRGPAKKSTPSTAPVPRRSGSSKPKVS